MNSLKAKKEMVSLRVPVEFNHRLTEYVKKRGMTKNSFILSLLTKELDSSPDAIKSAESA